MVVLHPCSEIWYQHVLCPVFPYLGPAVQWLLLNTVGLLSAPGSIQPENPRQPAIGIFSKLGASKIFSPFLVLPLPCSHQAMTFFVGEEVRQTGVWMNVSSEPSAYQMPCFTYVYSHQFVFPVVLNECQCILNTFIVWTLIQVSSSSMNLILRKSGERHCYLRG